MANNLTDDAREFLMRNGYAIPKGSVFIDLTADFAAKCIKRREAEIAGELAEIHLIGHCPGVEGL